MSTDALSRRCLAALPWALGLWAVGVQVHEALATSGAWLTAVLVLVVTLTSSTTHQSRPFTALTLFIAWSLGPPLITGHLPTATGLARMSDFLLIPAAALCIERLDVRALHRVAMAAGVTLALSVIVAGLQHFGWWPPLEFFAPLEGSKLGFYRVYERAPGETNVYMAGGLLLHRLKFANVTAAVCVGGAAAVIWRVPRWPLFAAFTALGLLGVTLFPYARAAAVSAVLAVSLTWVCGAQRRGRALVGALGFIALAVTVSLAVPSLRERFSQSFSAAGSGERASLTQAGLKALGSSPVVGIGLGRFRPGDFLPADAPAQAREHPGKAHNQFVTIAAEAGLPAALLLLLVVGGWLMWGLRYAPRGAMVAGACGLFTLLCALHDPLFHPESSLALMLLLGAGIGAVLRDAKTSPSL